DGERICPISDTAADHYQTEVREFRPSTRSTAVKEILKNVPFPLQGGFSGATYFVSHRVKGIEGACVRDGHVSYPLGEPLANIIKDLDGVRCYGSRHPLARAYEERWLESNIIGQMGALLPAVHPEFIYPQVPSFIGEDRNIIDLLTVTHDGRLVVMEIKASADPDLPFQALDYWIAVERHRKRGDFQRKGYFNGVMLK